MKRKNLLILALILAFPLTALSQNFSNVRAYYRLTFQIDSTDNEFVNTEDMILYMNEQTSKFASANQYIRDDSIKAEYERMIRETGQIDGTKIAPPPTLFKWKVFKNSNNIEVYDVEMAQDYRYSLKKNHLKWTLHQEKRTISKFLCQKATTYYKGRNYTAWFTTDIPYSEGPYVFSGLPGLIVKISDENNHYNFELIKIENFNNYNLATRPNKYVDTSFEELHEMKLAKRRNPVAYLNSIMSVNLSEYEEQQMIERNKRINNHIEL